MLARTSSTSGSRSGRNWLEEGPEVIAELKARGLTLSIDTLDPEEILMADAAGVDYVLSLNGDNRHVAQQLRATPVLIPDTPDDLESLDATIAHLAGARQATSSIRSSSRSARASPRASAATSRCAAATPTPRC